MSGTSSSVASFDTTGNARSSTVATMVRSNGSRWAQSRHLARSMIAPDAGITSNPSGHRRTSRTMDGSASTAGYLPGIVLREIS